MNYDESYAGPRKSELSISRTRGAVMRTACVWGLRPCGFALLCRNGLERTDCSLLRLALQNYYEEHAAGGPQAETRVVARAPRASPGVVRPPRRTSHEPFRSTLPFRRDAAAHSSAPRLVPSKVYHGNWINQSLGSKNVRYSGSSAAVTSGGGSLSSR